MLVIELLKSVEEEIAKWDRLKASIHSIFDTAPKKSHHRAKPVKKRNLSKAGRKAISDAAKRRWASARTKKK